MEGNCVAHSLTQLGFSFLTEQVWIEEIPHNINQVVLNDLAH